MPHRTLALAALLVPAALACSEPARPVDATSVELTPPETSRVVSTATPLPRATATPQSGKLVGFHLPQPNGPKLGEPCKDNPELAANCGTKGTIAIENQHMMGPPVRPCDLHQVSGPTDGSFAPYINSICVEGDHMLIVGECMACRIPGEGLALVDLAALSPAQHADLRRRLGLPGAEPDKPPPGPASVAEWRAFASGLPLRASALQLPGPPALPVPAPPP